MNTYTATLPNGEKVTTNSSRKVTHLIARRTLTDERGNAVNGEWSAFRWSGSESAALKASRAWECIGGGKTQWTAESAVIPVTEDTEPLSEEDEHDAAVWGDVESSDPVTLALQPAETPAEPVALPKALPESVRANFAFMAEHANTESARAYWAGRLA